MNFLNNIPNITKNLLIINVLAYVATFAMAAHGIDLEQMFALHYFRASGFMPYQLLTYMFLHGSFTHLLFNMFTLWMFGCVIEQMLGEKRFLIYYLVCGLGAAFFQELVQFLHFWGYEIVDHAMSSGGLVEGKFFVIDNKAFDMNLFRTVGASGAVYGILLAFGMMFPDERMFIIPFPFPIKAKYMVGGYAMLELLLAMSSSSDGVAHMAHVGGMVFGFFLLHHWRRMQGHANAHKSVREYILEFLNKHSKPRMKVTRGTKLDDEMDYNARRKAQDDEIDRILDKVKKHGYGSLSEDEKRKLFSAGGRK